MFDHLHIHILDEVLGLFLLHEDGLEGLSGRPVGVDIFNAVGLNVWRLNKEKFRALDNSVLGEVVEDFCCEVHAARKETKKLGSEFGGGTFQENHLDAVICFQVVQEGLDFLLGLIISVRGLDVNQSGADSARQGLNRSEIRGDVERQTG